MAGVVRITSAFVAALAGLTLVMACSGAFVSPDLLALDSEGPPALAGGELDAGGLASIGAASAPEVADAEVEAGDVACGPADCDCDRDGFLRAACADGGKPDGGADCDDTDPQRRPNQVYLAEASALPDGGDWNCNGAVEKLYPTNVGCTGFATSNCVGKQGFEGNPGCGEEGTYVFCHAAGIVSCGVDPARTTRRKQSCR